MASRALRRRIGPSQIPPPPQGHREHLRSRWIGLAHTHGMIERGAAAFAESMQLLERLNGQGEQL